MSAVWNAAVGLVALYALLLQAVMAAATPTGQIAPPGVICAAAGSAHQPPDKPVGHDHACCTALHFGNLAPPPSDPAPEPIRWPKRILVVWQPEARLPRTGPPAYAHSARGPPGTA